jgi:hypothetical protein
VDPSEGVGTPAYPDPQMHSMLATFLQYNAESRIVLTGSVLSPSLLFGFRHRQNGTLIWTSADGISFDIDFMYALLTYTFILPLKASINALNSLVACINRRLSTTKKKCRGHHIGKSRDLEPPVAGSVGLSSFKYASFGGSLLW